MRRALPLVSPLTLQPREGRPLREARSGDESIETSRPTSTGCCPSSLLVARRTLGGAARPAARSPGLGGQRRLQQPEHSISH